MLEVAMESWQSERIAAYGKAVHTAAAGAAQH